MAAGIPTIVAGNIFTWDQVNTIVAAGRSDLVALARTHLYNPYFTQQAAAHYGYDDMDWPDQYASAKFAAFREFERERLAVEDLREATKPEGRGVARSFASRSTQASKSEWEMQAGVVGVAAAEHDS